MTSDGRIKVAQVIGRVAEGGVEKMITNLYQHIDHSKVVFDFFVENTSLIVNKEELEKYGGKVIIIPPYKKLFKFNKTLKYYFKEGQYDIVHVNMNTLSVFALRIAKKAGIKIRISHSHSTSNRKELIRHVIKQLLRPFSKLYPTHYFACSGLAGKWLFGNKLYKSGKVEIINNAIDLDYFKYNEAAGNQTRNELGISNDQKIIGHVGRFCAQKNQPFLIDTFNEICKVRNDVSLIFIGTGEDELEVRKKVDEYGLTDKVHFVGAVPNVAKYYNAMDCFALPSIYEGLPVVGVEAQANRLKCFFSKNVTQEAILLKETEQIDLKEGSKKWADSIVKFLDTNQKRVIGDFDEKYDINKISQKLLSLYEKYISESAK